MEPLQAAGLREQLFGTDRWKGLQSQIAAPTGEVSVFKSQASSSVSSTVETAQTLVSQEQMQFAYEEAALRSTRKQQLCIQGCTFPEETSNNLMSLSESFLREELHLSETDSKVADVRGITSKSDKAGPLIISCTSLSQQTAILKASKLLNGKSVYINPNYTKQQAEEQYQPRQQRRKAISQGQKAYFKSGKLIIEPAQQGTAATVSSQHTPSAAYSAASASPSHQ